MTDPSVAREASDPTTPPERLAALAHDHPEARTLIAANPAAYDALLDWLAQYGDATVQAAVAARRGTAPTVPAVAPTVPAVVPGASAVAPAASGPDAAGTAAPRRGFLARLPKPLLFGGLGAIALVVVGVVVLVLVLSGRGSASASGPVPPVELTSEPRVAWRVESLHPEIAPTLDTVFGADAVTVAPHRALLRESLSSEEGSGEESTRRVLLDTSTGAILWDLPDELVEAYPVPIPGNTAVMLFVQEDRITSVRLSDGTIAGEMDGGLVFSRGLGEILVTVDGDVLVRIADGIARVDPAGMTVRWRVSASLGASETVVASQGVLLAGTKVYSLADGRELSWTADADQYGDIAGRLIRAAADGGRLALVDPATGAERWSIAVGDETSPVFWTTDFLGVYDESTLEVSVIGLDDGRERWSTTIARDAYGYAIAENAGVVILPVDRSVSTAYDMATGRVLYDITMSEDGDWPLQLMGATDRTLYFQGGREGEVQAFDARSGTRRWSFANPFSNWYSFAFWGGDLVAFHTLSGSDGADQPHYLGLR